MTFKLLVYYMSWYAKSITDSRLPFEHYFVRRCNSLHQNINGNTTFCKGGCHVIGGERHLVFRLTKVRVLANFVLLFWGVANLFVLPLQILYIVFQNVDTWREGTQNDNCFLRGKKQCIICMYNLRETITFYKECGLKALDTFGKQCITISIWINKPVKI